MSESQPEPGPQPARRAKKASPLLLALGVLAALFVGIDYGGCLGDAMTSDEQSKIAALTIDRFMERMAARQPERAKLLFSRSVSPEVLESGMSALSKPESYPLFARYQGIVIQGARSNVRQGCVAREHLLDVGGTVNYAEGEQGQFRATLTRQDGAWTLVNIHVNAPASRMPAP